MWIPSRGVNGEYLKDGEYLTIDNVIDKGSSPCKSVI